MIFHSSYISSILLTHLLMALSKWIGWIRHHGILRRKNPIRLKKLKQNGEQIPTPYLNLKEDSEVLYLPIQSD